MHCKQNSLNTHYKQKNYFYVGDYKPHKGNPSILRSDSMLKAIGKSINIRISNLKSSKIPIIVRGNSPITKSYQSKVDFLKQAGIIQGFVSINPKPNTDEFIKETKFKGFQTFDNYDNLKFFIHDLINSNTIFFSSMISKRKLGEIIAIIE